MLKLVGAGMTIVCCGAMGAGVCRDMRKRIRLLQELRRMAIILTSEITYANAALEEAFAELAKRLADPAGAFFGHVRQRMQEGEHGVLGEIFKKQSLRDFKGSGLKKTDLESLWTLGGQLGYLDTEMQKKTLAYYLEQVNAACMQAQEEYKEKEKLFRCLGISAGIFLVILLY